MERSPEEGAVAESNEKTVEESKGPSDPDAAAAVKESNDKTFEQEREES